MEPTDLQVTESQDDRQEEPRASSDPPTPEVFLPSLQAASPCTDQATEPQTWLFSLPTPFPPRKPRPRGKELTPGPTASWGAGPSQHLLRPSHVTQVVTREAAWEPLIICWFS